VLTYTAIAVAKKNMFAATWSSANATASHHIAILLKVRVAASNRGKDSTAHEPLCAGGTQKHSTPCYADNFFAVRSRWRLGCSCVGEDWFGVVIVLPMPFDLCETV